MYVYATLEANMPYGTNGWYRRRAPLPKLPECRPPTPISSDFTDHITRTVDEALHNVRVKAADRVRAATERMLGEREPYESPEPPGTQRELFPTLPK